MSLALADRSTNAVGASGLTLPWMSTGAVPSTLPRRVTSAGCWPADVLMVPTAPPMAVRLAV